jgi:hypothetical protein
MSSINGMPFEQAVIRCKTSEELSNLVQGYPMSAMELDLYEERLNHLMDYEAMDLYADDAKTKAEEFVVRVHGRDHPDFERLVAEQAKGEMETEWSIRQGIDAAVKTDTRRMEREDDRQRELIASIDNVADTVEESSAYAQGKKLVNRHPFLTALIGPTIVKKLFGS